MTTPVVQIGDSRRLTGPNLLADGPGAVIDGSVSADVADDFLAAWNERALQVLRAVGWADESTRERRYDGGVTVFMSAPVDALYAATEVNEWAWAAAAADVEAGPPAEGLDSVVQQLRQAIEEERNPALMALREAALERGVSFLSDDDHASVGMGRGSLTWAVDDLPAPDDVPWRDVHDVPCVMVTGTNGKTTTVRMVASIIEASGRTPGFTCTDGIYVGGNLIDAGDWAGPGGARAVLRHGAVDVAILETARGGMLRRGLAVDRADGALVTNVAADHLGEWGVLDVADVARAKLVIAKSVRHGAPLLVNADDAHLSAVAQSLARPLTWIAVENAEWVRSEAGTGDVAWIAQDGWLTRIEPGGTSRVVDIAMIPAALGGAAIYNVSNALGAAALCRALGCPDDAIRAGLTGFDASPESSPGRGNLFELGGVRVLVDFVHNPHGFQAVARMIERLAPKRIGLMVGHAGDRDEDAIRDLARAAWGVGPDRVAIKEMEAYLRGREPGEIPAIIRAELSELGAPSGSVSTHPSESAAARALLEWAEEGDLLLLSSQADRDGVLGLVKEAGGLPVTARRLLKKYGGSRAGVLRRSW